MRDAPEGHREGETQRATFIVRLWRAAGEPRWRGVIELVGSDRRGALGRPSDSLSFIERSLAVARGKGRWSVMDAKDRIRAGWERGRALMAGHRRVTVAVVAAVLVAGGTGVVSAFEEEIFAEDFDLGELALAAARPAGPTVNVLMVGPGGRALGGPSGTDPAQNARISSVPWGIVCSPAVRPQHRVCAKGFPPGTRLTLIAEDGGQRDASGAFARTSQFVQWEGRDCVTPAGFPNYCTLSLPSSAVRGQFPNVLVQAHYRAAAPGGATTAQAATPSPAASPRATTAPTATPQPAATAAPATPRPTAAPTPVPAIGGPRGTLQVQVIGPGNLTGTARHRPTGRTETLTCESPACNWSIAADTALTIRATPAAGGRFTSWGGECTRYRGSPSCLLSFPAQFAGSTFAISRFR